MFSAYLNDCYIPCEEGVGMHPNCYCGANFNGFYDAETRKCKSFSYPGRPCPPGSVGVAPNCLCMYGFFHAFGWGCFTAYASGNLIAFPCDNYPQCEISP